MLRIHDLNISFPLIDNGAAVYAVRSLELHLPPYETLVIIGESGSGKSVLGMSILALLPVNAVISGDIFYHQTNLLEINPKALRHIRGNEIGFVPQSAGLSLNPTMKIGSQLADIFRERKGESRRNASLSSLNLLEAFQLTSDVAKLYPHQLSGGMRQRVLLAIGFAADPDLLIIDEPTKGLDYNKKEDVERMIRSVKAKKPAISILLITHDIELAQRLGDRIGVMYSGQLVEVAPAARFFKQPQHPYSQGLIEASPLRSMTPIKGNMPAMDKIPAGCTFAPRCPYTTDQCRNRRPILFNGSHAAVMCWRYESSRPYDNVN